MVESSEPPVAATGEGVSAAPSPSQRQHESPDRLTRSLMWVGIIAGVLFILAVVVFSGLFIGATAGYHRGWHHGDGFHASQGDSVGGCPMMGPDGMMGPVTWGPGKWGPVTWGPVQPSPTSPGQPTPRP